MFEVLISLIFILIIFIATSFWIKLMLFAVMILIIAPGFYSMLFGAPFVLTKKKQLAAILKLGNFQKDDVVYDLGCGDGRIIRAVAKVSVRKAIGYEFSLPTFLFAWVKTFLKGGREEIYFKNIWNQNYEDGDVLVLFLMDNAMRDFEKNIWPKLKKGTRVVSNSFLMSFDANKNLDGVYLYVRTLKCEMHNL